MNLTEIHFPVFRLLTNPPEWENGLLVYKNVRMEISSANEYTLSKVVDADVPGETLSRRRLHLGVQGYALYPLSKAAFFLHDFLKLAGKGHYFIDSSGKVFKHKKSMSCKLVFRRVTRIIPSDTTGSIVEVEGLSQRFKTMIHLDQHMPYWVGLLRYQGSWLFYGVYDTQYRDTRRMV